MKTYPGLPEPRTETLLDYEASRERYQGKAEFFIAAYWLCANTGTYVDAPRHRYRDGDDLAALPLERLAGIPVTVLHAVPLAWVGGASFPVRAYVMVDRS